MLLEAETEGVASHRAVRFAKEPGTEGLWVKAPWYDWKWDEQDDSWSWNEETAKRGMAVVVGFPGKLFMDRRLAKAAEGVVEREEGEAVAVYRAWKGEMVITDVEIDGVSVKELARRARAAEAEEKTGT